MNNPNVGPVKISYLQGIDFLTVSVGGSKCQEMI